MSKNPLAASALNPRSWSPPATAASSFLSTMLPSAPSLASPAVSTAQSCHRVMGWHPCAAGPCHQALTVSCRGHPSLGPYLDDFGMFLVRTSVSLWSFGAQTSRGPCWDPRKASPRLEGSVPTPECTCWARLPGRCPAPASGGQGAQILLGRWRRVPGSPFPCGGRKAVTLPSSKPALSCDGNVEGPRQEVDGARS